MASLAEFDSTLRALAEELGEREVHLATLGSRIRARLPGFNAGAHGHTSFTELCQSRTEVGVVKFGEKPEDRWFVFHEPLKPQPPSQFQIVQSHSQVVQPVWDACVDIENTHRAWLDFMDYSRVVTDAGEVEAEPERYVELPRFDRAKQAELLKAFAESCDEHMQPTLREFADAWGSGANPYSQLLEELTRCGLRHQWFVRLRQVVEQELRKWAADHGLPPGELFKRIVPSKAPPRTNSPIVPHELALNEHEFRSFLKSAIDEMTLAELSQWSIPARLLLRR